MGGGKNAGERATEIEGNAYKGEERHKQQREECWLVFLLSFVLC